ncbi:MAG TPA: tetratricopeptide repeat protein [Candidatus Angelobacter sp.]|nr:tetratricopeptide repeat protein [Candidatus Angelobacter sp.]
MKRIAMLLLIVVAAVGAFAQNATTSVEVKLSPAERNITQARRLIEKNPKDFEAFNALALALSRRARETSDVAFYAQAEEALKNSFAISPDNFDGARIHAWLLLGKHEFASALEEATRLNKKMPDDVMVYGFLTDANVELGNYKAAEAAAQRMLDLRPGNLAALTRAAYLRELFGDVDGALELMNMAFQSTPPREVEDGAWILTQMAHLKLSVGKADEAEALLKQALAIFPDYHYAMGNLAKVRIEQRRYDDAVELLKKRYLTAPHAENLFDLAEALKLSGREQEASRAFSEFEKKSLLESDRADNSNHELIFYYADYARQPGKALEVATSEFARRHDVFTLDSYAWALYVNGQYAAARKQIEAALEAGIRDAKLLRHAGEIALKNGDRAAAEHYLRQSAELNGVGSEQARNSLKILVSNTAGK